METGSAEHCSGNTTISKKVATALRGNGLIQVTKTSISQKEEKHRMPEEKME
jgi:hypothetical protein